MIETIVFPEAGWLRVFRSQMIGRVVSTSGEPWLSATAAQRDSTLRLVHHVISWFLVPGSDGNGSSQRTTAHIVRLSFQCERVEQIIAE